MPCRTPRRSTPSHPNYDNNTWGWEGNCKGKDFDYKDLVVQIDFTSAYGEGWLV